MQSVITILILILAYCYVGWRVYRLLHGCEDPCAACELKKNCK